MPAPVHNPAAQALPHMADTPDPQPPQHTPAAAAAIARPRIRDQIAENPLASLLGAVIVVLLGFNLTFTHDRINRLEDKVDAGFDSLESDVAEINLKLTALIAHLNATDAVDAALEGRLTGDGANATDQPR